MTPKTVARTGVREDPARLQEGDNRVHAIRVLEEDHARIEALLNELTCAGEASRAKLSERIARELVVHTTAEDYVFFPHVEEAVEDSNLATEQFFDGDPELLTEASRLLARSYEHNGRIRELLQRPRPATSEEEIDGLRRAVRLHIELEAELFPKAREVLEEEDFERVGDLIEHCKWQVRGLAQSRLASSASFRPSPVETLLE
ncbi:MAG TPA: hemerythrin domain-containing protein [Rubrobacter sp.]